ncbi:MAG TPA: FAD-dependent oxidoreductase [Kiritimatiellia bacterium]|nr:FAD-dependent oxidoreductase [Kiritimatiellia bacterium]
MKPPPIILGAGLAGLGAAAELPGAVVYEARDHPGGHVWSHRQHGVCFDEGAHICHARSPDWRAQLSGHAGRVVDIPQSRVANWWHGLWLTYPVQNHLRDLPPDLRIRALSDLVSAQVEFRGRAPANYGEWVRFQYGEFLAERFYREYTDKYWRTPMEAMDTDWLSGRLLPAHVSRIVHGAIAPLDEKQSVFSSFLYPEQGGFYAFFKPFTAGLDIRTGARLVALDARARTLRFADGREADFGRLISTIPLPELASVTRDLPDGLLRHARLLRHTRMLVVNVLIARPALSPWHWFYIYDPDIDVARVKVMSNITAAGCPVGTTVLQAEIFRRDDEAIDASGLSRVAVRDLGRLLGFDPDRDVTGVGTIEVSHAYPIPLLGRAGAVAALAQWYADHGVTLAGLYGRWKYMWSDEAYQAGRAAARALTASPR